MYIVQCRLYKTNSCRLTHLILTTFCKLVAWRGTALEETSAVTCFRTLTVRRTGCRAIGPAHRNLMVTVTKILLLWKNYCNYDTIVVTITKLISLLQNYCHYDRLIFTMTEWLALCKNCHPGKNIVTTTKEMPQWRCGSWVWGTSLPVSSRDALRLQASSWERWVVSPRLGASADWRGSTWSFKNQINAFRASKEGFIVHIMLDRRRWWYIWRRNTVLDYRVYPMKCFGLIHLALNNKRHVLFKSIKNC